MQVLSICAVLASSVIGSVVDDCVAGLDAADSNYTHCAQVCSMYAPDGALHYLCSSATTGEEMLRCLLRQQPMCKAANSNDVTPTESPADMLAACVAGLDPTMTGYKHCKDVCAMYLPKGPLEKMCPGAATGADILKCLMAQQPQCASSNQGSGSSLVDECAAGLDPAGPFYKHCKEVCGFYAPGGALNALCPDATTGQEMLKCILEQQPFCNSDGGVPARSVQATSVVDDCAAGLEPTDPAYKHCKEICGYYAPGGPLNALCPEATTGQEMLTCISKQQPFCVLKSGSDAATKATDATTLVEDCAAGLEPSDPAYKHCKEVCAYYAPGGPLNSLCPQATSGQEMLACISKQQPFCVLKA